MNKKPLFSIITVSYNSSKTIERTIQSVLAQTYTEYEYIIIDGLSVDDTMKIVRRYEMQFHGRMRWISGKDKGIYDAMNKGIRMATGDIVGIVNSDDWLEKDALEKIYQCYVNNGHSLNAIYCGWIAFHYLNGDIQILRTNPKMLDRLSAHFVMGGIRHPAVFVPKLVYNEYGIFDDRMKVMADTDLILRYYFAGIQFCYPNKIISHMSDGGISNHQLLKACNDYRLILQKYKMAKLTFYWLLYSWEIKRIIKTFMSAKFLYYYRQLRA